MTKANFIGSKQRARATSCKTHTCCVIHSVKRSCGHTENQHDSSKHASTTSSRLALWKSTPCGDCDGMLQQGIIILNNFPVFAQ